MKNACPIPRRSAWISILALLLIPAFAADPKTHVGSSGLYGLLTTNIAPGNAQVTTFLGHSDFVGVSVRTYWRDIEPSEDVYNWAYYDSVIAAAQGAGKKVILRLEAAWASPAWVITAVQNAGGPIYQYYEKHQVTSPDVKESMPLPWDATYLAHWNDFVAEFGARYNGNATVAGVLISGCSRSTEMYLPAYPADGGPDWYASPQNYTAQKLIDAWEEVIDAYAAAFPDKPIGLSLSTPLADDGVVEAVAAYGVIEHPWHFYPKISYWNNNNSPTYYPTEALLAIADEYTHGGLEPAGAAQADVTANAINNAISWHTLGIFEVYLAQRDNFTTLKAEIDGRRNMIEKMTFTATPQSGQALLAWTVGSPNPYPTGFKVLRKTGDFPAGIGDGAATTVYDGNNTGGLTDGSLTNGTTYYYSVFEKGDGYTLAQATVTPNVVQTTVTLESNSTADGWVRESSENSSVGGMIDNAGGLFVGDDAGDRQYKAVVSFDTSSIPAGATVVAATLRLRRSTLTGQNPFGTHGTCYADIVTGNFNGSVALEAADWQAAANQYQVATMSNPAANGDLSTGTLNSAGRGALNNAGTTQLRVYFSNGDNDDAGNDYISFYSGNNGTPANRPVLEITYQQ